MTTNKDDNNSINNNDNDNDNHVCAVRLMMSWVHAGHVLPVIFFFFHLAPYSLGCGASCDSSDILA